MTRARHARLLAMLVGGLLLYGRVASAEAVAGEPLLPISAPYPPEGDGREVQVVVQLVVAADGHVESAIETSRAPANAPDAFATAALEAAKRATFRPSTRDGKPVRSRLEYVVVFRPPGDRVLDIEQIEQPAAAASPSERPPLPATVTVRGSRQERGLGELQIDRELLDAAPHLGASELLSAAPGFFVDHEDSEGLGNDVNLRGFDADHGAGIEFHVGAVPVSQPLNAHKPGYADLNFIIPEVVRRIDVLEGAYDPRQGDNAIAGSATFDLGVAERGYHLKGSYGSFRQRRLAAIVAPENQSDDTFLAFAWRETAGFGQNRASSSGSAMGAYAFDLGSGYRAKLSLAAYAARAALPGFVRTDDFDAGRIGFYDSYAGASGQSALASRAHVSLDVEHSGEAGEQRAAFAIWAALTGLRTRENLTGSTLASPIDPALHPGDLFETTNSESAFGARALVHSKTYQLASFARLSVEPGLDLRAASSDEGKSLIEPGSFAVWNRLIDAGIQSLDAGAYFDADVKLFRRLRLSGGLRTDALLVNVRDRLAGAASAAPAVQGRRGAFGLAVSPRVSAGIDVVPWLEPVVSYGEGFRSLEAVQLADGETRPYSKARSMEAGVRSKVGDRYRTSLSFYQTWMESELVFEPETGAYETEGASVRRGILAAILAQPVEWLAGSFAFNYNHAEFTEPRDARFVPQVPSVLVRADVMAHAALATIAERRFDGWIGTGTTYIAGRRITDSEVSAPALVLNARAGARYGWAELDVDFFNLLGRRYPDEEAIYASTLGSAAGAPTIGRHFTAAAPFTALATLALHFGG